MKRQTPCNCKKALCKGGATLSFTDFPSSVPVVDAIFVNNPAEEDPLSGFRSSSRTGEAGRVEDENENVERKEIQAPMLGSIHNAREHQTEYTPGFRGTLRKPRSFTQQKGEAEGDAEKSDGKTDTEGTKDVKAGRIYKKHEYKNGKAEGIPKKHEHREEMQRTSCTGNSEDGACLDTEEEKSVSLGSADAIAAASSRSTALSPATIPLGPDAVSETRSLAASRNPATAVNAPTSTNAVSTTLNVGHAGFVASATPGSVGANVDPTNIAAASTTLVTSLPTTIPDFENSPVSLARDRNDREGNDETSSFYQAMKECIGNGDDNLGADILIQVRSKAYTCWEQTKKQKPEKCHARFERHDTHSTDGIVYDIVNCRGTFFGGVSWKERMSSLRTGSCYADGKRYPCGYGLRGWEYGSLEETQDYWPNTERAQKAAQKMKEIRDEVLWGVSWMHVDQYLGWFVREGTDRWIRILEADRVFYHEMEKCIRGDGGDAIWDGDMMIQVGSTAYECAKKHDGPEWCEASFKRVEEAENALSTKQPTYYIKNCRGEDLDTDVSCGRVQCRKPLWANTWMYADKFLQWYANRGTRKLVVFHAKSSAKYLTKMEDCLREEKSSDHSKIQIGDALWKCWKRYYPYVVRKNRGYFREKYGPDEQGKKPEYVQPDSCLAYIQRDEGNKYQVQNCRGEPLNLGRNVIDIEYSTKPFLNWFAKDGKEPGRA